MIREKNGFQGPHLEETGSDTDFLGQVRAKWDLCRAMLGAC